MKKLFALLAIFGMLFFASSNIMAQGDQPAETEDTTLTAAGDSGATEAVTETPAETAPAEEAKPAEEAGQPMHQMIKQKFIEGGPFFMSFILLAFIFGLALCIERIIYLNLASTNTQKLLAKIEEALNTGGIEAAKEVCRNTRGPVAAIFYQGLDRYNPQAENTIEIVEKSIIAYGGVQMGQLEKGVSWISLFIALAPMLGFLGTVIGMIEAFDAIQAAGDIQPSLVAGGIKVALITTVFGLIVAMILQVFYNYIIAKVDNIVNEMEDASISIVDLIVKYNLKK